MKIKWTMTAFLFVMCVIVFPSLAIHSSEAVDELGCNVPNDLSLVDALETSGNHTLFLTLLETYDLEGYTILEDAELSDKTIWAPVDGAFDSVDLTERSDDEIKAILGYHISPPLSRPNGEYPIVTWEYITEHDNQIFRTRTGVLTGSDQRVSLSRNSDTFFIEESEIYPIVQCAQAGSVISIADVITEVEPPSFFVFTWYRLVRILLYEDIRFVIYAVVPSVLFGTGISIYMRRKK